MGCGAAPHIFISNVGARGAKPRELNPPLLYTVKVVGIEPLARFAAYSAQALLLEGRIKSRIGKQLRKCTAAALLCICHIILPRLCLILLYLCPEFKRHRLRKAVVNIIERHRINVMLTLPALSLAVERDLSVKALPRHIYAQKMLPFSMALRRCQIGIVINYMLEMVYHGAVGDERQRAGQMAVAELARVAAEKALSPGPGEEFHGHGMYLARLHAGPDIAAGNSVTVRPRFKRVSRLVSHDLNIALRAVEVCKYKRNLVVKDAGAVAAALLALF